MLRGKRPPRVAGWGFAAHRQRLLQAATGVAAALGIGGSAAPPADAKAPGARYCFHGYCHRVGTLAQTDTLVGWRGYVLASYYDSCGVDRLNPCGLTSSGAVFRPDLADNAASPLLPDGTVILAYNPKTGDASVLRITNAGPYSGKRKLDVSRAAADKLGFRKQGVAPLVLSVLQSPTKQEASYVRRRVYPAVPGHLGKFASFDAAIAAAEAVVDADQDSEQLAGAAGSGLETASLANDARGVPKPRLAVSPALARELVMLRTAPRPVNRVRKLVQGPRPMSAASFWASRSPAYALVRIDFASGLRNAMDVSEVPGAGE